MEKIAVYKGKRYKLLWSGQTKHGRRAKLGWFNGQNEFWVNEDALEVESDASQSQEGGGRISQPAKANIVF